MGVVLRNIRNFLSSHSRDLRRYRKLRRTKPVDATSVLLEQQCGVTANGNLFHIARELCSNPDYAGMKVFFAAARGKASDIEAQLEARGLDVEVVIRSSRRYHELLATAKYLACDTTFPPELAVRSDQVMLNTWHGTPLKTLGCDAPGELQKSGNTQRSFIIADYILYPNEFTREHLSAGYQFANFTNAVGLLGGYPRNSALFAMDASTGSADGARRTYAYLPTFRTSLAENGAKSGIPEVISVHLSEVDGLLSGDEVMYAQLHPILDESIDFKAFKRIKPFPKEVETYDFLSRCDVLATDYSSVMFDFAATGRKVVLFAFDKEDYLAERGFYLDLDDLPFPCVGNAKELVRELRDPKQYDDERLLRELCPWDSPLAASVLCKRVFMNDGNAMDERRCDEGKRALVWMREKPFNREKWERALDIARDMAQDHAVLMAFPERLAKKNPDWIAAKPDGVSFYPVPMRHVYLLGEMIATTLCELGVLGKRRIESRMGDYERFEWRRVFGSLDFDREVCL